MNNVSFRSSQSHFVDVGKIKILCTKVIFRLSLRTMVKAIKVSNLSLDIQDAFGAPGLKKSLEFSFLNSMAFSQVLFVLMNC